MKYFLVPGMLVVMALVMANAISITVRFRFRTCSSVTAMVRLGSTRSAILCNITNPLSVRRKELR